jgi:hypothetical protein
MVSLPAVMPIPGNAELVFLVVVAAALGILAWVADGLNDNDWWLTFTVLAAAYLLSRGIAKASRVLEQ